MAEQLIFQGYELLTVLLPCIAVFIVLALKNKRNGKKNSVSRFLLVCVFAVYVWAVFYVTGAGTFFELLRLGKEIPSEQYNFVPFSNHIMVWGYAMNVVMFIPLGFLMPLIWRKMDKFQYVLLAGLYFSLLIEISQIFNQRATDVDDLIMNTLGALVGCFCYKVFALVIQSVTKRTFAQPHSVKFEPAIYIGVMFVGHFFLFDGMGMALILYP